MKSVLFYNWTEEDFTWSWDSVPFEFKAGDKLYVQDYLAEHFAKHLVDRELLKQGLRTDHFSRQELINKCIVNRDAKEQSAVKVQQEILNKNNQESEKISSNATPPKRFCESCDSKGVRHKKGCPNDTREIFEGLKNETLVS